MIDSDMPDWVRNAMSAAEMFRLQKRGVARFQKKPQEAPYTPRTYVRKTTGYRKATQPRGNS